MINIFVVTHNFLKEERIKMYHTQHNYCFMKFKNIYTLDHEI
jgi:hypothetical protein